MLVDKDQIIKDFETNAIVNAHLEIDVEREVQILSYCLDIKKKGDPKLIVDALLKKSAYLIDDSTFLRIFHNGKCYEESYENLDKLISKKKRELLVSALNSKKFTEEDVDFLNKFWIKAINKIIDATEKGTTISDIKENFYILKGKHGDDGLSICIQMNNKLNDIIYVKK